MSVMTGKKYMTECYDSMTLALIQIRAPVIWTDKLYRYYTTCVGFYNLPVESIKFIHQVCFIFDLKPSLAASLLHDLVSKN